MRDKPLIILTGPTAVGKTSLSINLAKMIGGEIISADSMQVYKGMDIGSAKIMPEEMMGVRHHLVDIIEPDEEFNVVRFKQLAVNAINDIYSRGNIPVIVGGTGFYIQAVLYDIDFTEQEDNSDIREYYQNIADEKGAEYLHSLLADVDPAAAEEIHFNNIKRVIRALEFNKITGTRISEHNKEQRARKSPYDFRYFVLNDDRDLLYDRIEKRIDIMLDNGLVEEVKALRDKGYTKDIVSMQGLGYKEILAWLDGDITFDEAVYILKRDTRHFAKRQLTWFRRESDVIWVNKPDFEYDEEKILKFMKSKIDC